MFPGAGKSLFAMLSIYIRIVFYLEKTKDSNYPSDCPRKRLPRFLYIATINDTVENCALRFIGLVEDLHAIYDPDAFKEVIGRKYAKDFTLVSIDEKLLSIANKGQQFDMDKVFYFKS